MSKWISGIWEALQEPLRVIVVHVLCGSLLILGGWFLEIVIHVFASTESSTCLQDSHWILCLSVEHVAEKMHLLIFIGYAVSGVYNTIRVLARSS